MYDSNTESTTPEKTTKDVSPATTGNLTDNRSSSASPTARAETTGENDSNTSSISTEILPESFTLSYDEIKRLLEKETLNPAGYLYYAVGKMLEIEHQDDYATQSSLCFLFHRRNVTKLSPSREIKKIVDLLLNRVIYSTFLRLSPPLLHECKKVWSNTNHTPEAKIQKIIATLTYTDTLEAQSDNRSATTKKNQEEGLSLTVKAKETNQKLFAIYGILLDTAISVKLTSPSLTIDTVFQNLLTSYDGLLAKVMHEAINYIKETSPSPTISELLSVKQILSTIEEQILHIKTFKLIKFLLTLNNYLYRKLNDQTAAQPQKNRTLTLLNSSCESLQNQLCLPELSLEKFVTIILTSNVYFLDFLYNENNPLDLASAELPHFEINKLLDFKNVDVGANVLICAVQSSSLAVLEWVIAQLKKEDKLPEQLTHKDCANCTALLSSIARGPEHLELILNSYPNKTQRLKAIKEKKTEINGNITELPEALFITSKHHECLKLILEQYPANKRLAAIKKIYKYQTTILHNIAFQDPEYLIQILKLLPNEEDRQAALNSECETYKTVWDVIKVNNPDYLEKMKKLTKDHSSRGISCICW